jgi:FixJ family two-component response regulator
MNGKPTIFLIDDDPAVRDSLTLLFEQQGFVIEAFASAAEFLASDKSRSQRRGCCIVDIRMPGMDGIALQAELAARRFLMPVIILTGFGSIPQTVRAIKAGAVDFLTKPITATILFESVQNALHECDRLMAQDVVTTAAAARMESLTIRERQVLALVAAGLPNKEVARSLGISHRTVEIHKARIMVKTGVENIFDLARLAELGAARN